ncbi:hypothetical protein I3300191I4_08560 [Megasphaera elsdenii]
MAVGNKAETSKKDAVAVGNEAKASDENAMAVGNKAEASKKDAVAVGNGAKALAEDAMAIGNGANVGEKGNASLAIGTGAQASGGNDIVIGHDAKNESNQSDGLIVIGHGATVSNNGKPKDSIAIGTSANVVGENNIAIGKGAAVTNNSGNNAISLGTEARAEKSESIAIGMNAHVNNNDGFAAIAIGSGSEAQKDKSIAIGYKTLVGNNGESGGIAIGSSIVNSQGTIITQTTAAQGNDIAFGVGAQTYNSNMNGHHGGAIAIGHLSYSNGNQDVAIGDNAKTGRDGDKNAGSQKMWDDGEGYVAIGANSFSNVGPGVIGYDPFEVKTKDAGAVWVSTNGAVSVGNVSDGDYTKWITRQITGVAAGSADTDAVNVAQLKAAISSVNTGDASSTSGDGVHFYSVNETDSTKGNYDNKGANGTDALAAGVGAKTSGNYATAVGNNAQALNEKAVALGNGAIAGSKEKGEGATAVGNNAKALGDNAVALGNGAMANGQDSIALGTGAVADGIGATVIGQYNKASGQDSLAFGGGYNKEQKGNTASGVASVAFGEGTQALSEGSVAFGYGTQAGNKIKGKNDKYTYTGQNAVAFGNGTKALGGRSLAFGENTTANFNDSVAFGNGATAFSSGATAFGNRSRALSQYSTSFGDNSVAAGSMSFAFGTDTIAGAALDDNGALELTDHSRMDSHGNKAYTTTDTAGNKVTYSIKGMGIPSGGDPHDYVVVTGTKADGTTGTYVEDYQGGIAEVKVNDDGTVTKVKDLYSGKYGGWYQYDENGKLVSNANGIPVVTASADMKSIPVTLDKATPGSNGYTLNGFKNATAFGYSTEASGDNATAFGNDTKAKASAATAFGTTTTASGDNATAFGLSTTASGKQTTAFGSSTTASGDNATAFGENSTASGEAATAFGIGSTASGKNSLAGLGGTASNENSIALGKDTKADNADSAVSVAIGQNAEASGAQSLAIGFGNVSETNQSGNTPYPVSATQAAAKGAIAIGINTGAKGEHSIAMGSYTDAAKDSSVAIGFDTHAVEDSSVAIGSGTKAAGRYSVALGLSSIAGTETNDEKNPLDGGGSVAMGYVASAEASRSIAIGTGATAADSQFTTAVGDSTTAQAEGSVAIGAGSIATRGAGNKESIVSTDINTGKTTITYGDEKKAYLKPDTLSTDKISTWESTTGAVSVGGQATYKEYDDNGNLVKKTKLLTRQITNVAAGSDDTDAVNVAQLKAAQPTVTSNDHSVTIDTTTDKTDYHKNYDLKIATATLSQAKTGTGDSAVETGKVTVTNPKISVTENGETKQVDNPNAYVTGNSVADAINNSGFKLTASASEGAVTGNKETLIHPGDIVTIDAGKNISLTQDKGKISIATKDNLNLGSADSKDDKQQDVPGTNGSITVNGRNGSSVAINGQDGSIGLTGPKGTDGTSTSIQMSTIMSDPTLDGGKNTKTTSGEGEQQTTTTQAPRIQYKNGNTTYEVATMDDGQKYAGDVQASDAKANAFSRKLNEQTNVVGGVTKLDALSTGNNVGVVSNGTDTLTIRLAKELTDLTSVTTVKKDAKGDKTSETVQDGNGITITPTTLGEGKSSVSLTDKGLSNGGNQITHVDSGLKDAAGHEVELKNATGDVLNNAVNVGDLKKVQNAVTSAHTAVTVNGGVGAPDAFGNYTKKEEGNLLLAQKKDAQTDQITYDLKLNDEVTLGKAGKDGVDGSIGLKGADGQSSIGLNGKDGISVIGKDGKNGVSITGSNGLNGKDGIDGKIAIGTPGKDGQPGKDAVSVSGQNGEGHIGLTGPKGPKGADGKDGQNASADIHVKNGQVGVDGTDGHGGKDGMDRVVYEDHNGVTHEVATMDDGQKYAGDFGDGASVKLNKTVNVKGNAKKEADLTDGNIGVVSSQSGDNGQLLIKLNKDLNLGDNGSVKMGNTTINNDGMTISKKESGKTTTVALTDKGLNNGGNKITNVVAGTDGTDAVNVSQLNDVKTLAGQHTTVEAGSKNITVKEGTNSTGGKNYTVDLAKDVAFGDAAKGDKTVAISGTNGTVTAGTGDNKVTVDGSKGQIVAGGDNGVKIGNIAGGDSSLTIYNKDGKATNQTDKAGKYVTNLDNKTWKDDGSYVSGRAATEDQLHQVESNVNKQIADVNTKVDKVDKHHTEVTVNGGTPAKADGAYTDGNLQLKQTTGEDGQKVYDLKLNDQLKVGQKGDAGKAGKDGNVTVETKGGTTVIIGHDGKDGKDGRDGLFVTGKDGKDGKSGVSITGPNGAAGTDGVDGKVGIAGKDGRDAVSIAGKDGVGHIGLTGPKGADGKDGTNIDISTVLGKGTLDRNQNEVKGEDKDGTKDQAARIQYQTTVKEADGTTKTITHEVATMDDGMKYGDDFGNTAKVKLNHQLDIVGDINAGKKDGDKKATKDDLSDGNIGIVATDTVYNDDGTVKENGKMTVKLAKDLKGLNSIESNSVTTGNTTINNGGLTIKTGDANRTITVQDGNVNMGGNQIHNVAPGQAPGDAINVSQLNATNYAVNKLGNRINRVGAGAAALAALHPLDFDPDDKWDFAAGYGNYRGANAAAVGAYYRPNEDTMFSIGGSFGGGENMVNAGVSFKVGQGNHVSTSRVAMAKEIKDLRQNVANLNAIVNRQSALIDKLTGTNAGMIKDKGNDLFPDVPANHWAYEYVTKLKHAGILTGYPDGNFDGDRMMTRYEFAAIVYRAIMAGAASNPALNQDGTLDKLANEFSSEMKYIRIDTIAKDKNGKPTIERVRVISDAK